MFTKKQQKILNSFFSNSDKPVFVLKNMPEVLKGALFSRYSRSSKSLRGLFLDEYLNSEEFNFGDKLKDFENYEKVNNLLLTDKAKNFYRKWLAMYGDDSIAELAGIHIGIEDISVVATKSIEDRRIGISPLEKSTRYVRFDDKVNGQYRYYRDPDILKSKFGKEYIRVMDNLFDTYTALIEPMTKYFIAKFPKATEVSDAAYNTSIKAKALDTLRGLLPLSTLTNMGIFANGRSVEYLLTKMYANELQEVKDFAGLIHGESKKFIENFVERVETENGTNYINYLKSNEKKTKKATENITSKEVELATGKYVKLVDYDQYAEKKIAASILFPYSNQSYKKTLSTANKLSKKQLKELIETYIQGRLGRWHKAGKAFEDVTYTFEIVSDSGAFKDLQRHRMLSMYKQLFTTEHGYDLPRDVKEAGFEKQYRKAIDQTNDLYKKVKKTMPYQAQYIACHGHYVRWRIKMNLREAFHLCELRSSPQGHPNYRQIAQQIYLLIKEVHPILGEAIKFVNMQDPGLERLNAEVRKEERLATLSHNK